MIVVDKPQGWTSHDVVARCRKLLGERSIGHLGTLDPMATGVLPLVIGKMTRLSQFYSGSQKRYEGTIRLGIATDTYDADGEVVGSEQMVQVSLEELQRRVRSFRRPGCSRLRRHSQPRRSRAFRRTSWRDATSRSS